MSNCHDHPLDTPEKREAAAKEFWRGDGAVGLVAVQPKHTGIFTCPECAWRDVFESTEIETPCNVRCKRCDASLTVHLFSDGVTGVMPAGPGAATAPGRKDDAEKPRWDLFPVEAMRAIVGVLTHGARKYSPENWRLVPDARRRYYAAAMRHLTVWWGGEDNDPDSGLNHLAHAATCLVFLLALPKTEEEGV